MGAVFADFDGDGLPELFVSNFMAQNRLFHNRGDSTFAECAAARGIAEPVASGPCATLDFDNDTLTVNGTTYSLKSLGEVRPVIDAGGLFNYARQSGMIAAKG